MYIYRKYEAYSPIFQGGYVNYIPLVYRFLTTDIGKEEDAKYKISMYISENDLYEMSDVTHPLSALENDYVNMTNYFLNQFKIHGLNEVIRKVLNLGYSFEVLDFTPLLRLQIAIENNEELEIAQSLSMITVFCNKIDYTSIPKEKEINRIFSETPFDRIEKPKEFIDHVIKEVRLIDNDKALFKYLIEYDQAVSNNTLRDAVCGLYGLLKLEMFFNNFNDIKRNYLVHATIALSVDEDINLSETQSVFKNIVFEYVRVKIDEEYNVDLKI